MNLNEEIIKVLLRISKRNEGALIVVGEADYKPMVEQEQVESFNILNNLKLFEILCLIDGAVVVKQNGMLEAYGVKIKSPLVWKNFGTKHSAGYSASVKEGTTAYVLSQEDSKIRIFKTGKLILEIDCKEKNIEKKIPEINNIMESVGYGTIGVVGATLLAPFIGITIISGVTIFYVTTGVVYALKKFKEMGWIK